MQLQLEIGGLTNNIRCISIPFEAVYYFYKAPVHLECDQAFYRRKIERFLTLLKKLKIQVLTQVEGASFSWFYFFYLQIFNCIIVLFHIAIRLMPGTN